MNSPRLDDSRRKELTLLVIGEVLQHGWPAVTSIPRKCVSPRLPCVATTTIIRSSGEMAVQQISF